MTKETARPTVGLCLSSGAMRGIAHIGVLDIFNKYEVPIDVMSGCSMGSIIGALYCCGIAPKNMEGIIAALDERTMFDVVIPRMGFIRGARLSSLLMTLTQNKDFSQTNIPFYVFATDLEAGEGVVINEGKLHEAVRASSSVPGVFEPAMLNGRLFVDGAVVERMPVEPLYKHGVDVVIGVDIGYRGHKQQVDRSALGILFASFELMEWEMNRNKTYHADYVISPDVSHISPARMNKTQESVDIGRKAALRAIPDIITLIDTRAAQLGYAPVFGAEKLDAVRQEVKLLDISCEGV